MYINMEADNLYIDRAQARETKSQTLDGKRQNTTTSYNFDSTSPMTTKMIVDGGVTTQYAQKIVRLMSRSNASPDAACVICASVSAGGDAISSTFDTTNTGLCQRRPLAFSSQDR